MSAKGSVAEVRAHLTSPGAASFLFTAGTPDITNVTTTVYHEPALDSMSTIRLEQVTFDSTTEALDTTLPNEKSELEFCVKNFGTADCISSD